MHGGKNEKHNKQRLVEMRTHSVRENNITDSNCDNRDIVGITGRELGRCFKRKRIGGHPVDFDIACGIARGEQ